MTEGQIPTTDSSDPTGLVFFNGYRDMPDMKEAIGKRLYSARKELGFSRTKLSRQSGINWASIYKIEAGNCARPRSIEKLAEAIRVNPAWLEFGNRWASKQFDFDSLRLSKNTAPSGIRPDDLNEILADRLRNARKSLGLSQAKLGKSAGVSWYVIQKIEEGKTLQPRCLKQIAKALDVNPAWLQYGGLWARRSRKRVTH
ncbi:MAG: helix-turn-helix transcriptional regulator [Candidatus Sedimenticola sp. 6PFRAG5]